MVLTDPTCLDGLVGDADEGVRLLDLFNLLFCEPKLPIQKSSGNSLVRSTRGPGGCSRRGLKVSHGVATPHASYYPLLMSFIRHRRLDRPTRHLDVRP